MKKQGKKTSYKATIERLKNNNNNGKYLLTISSMASLLCILPHLIFSGIRHATVHGVNVGYDLMTKRQEIRFYQSPLHFCCLTADSFKAHKKIMGTLPWHLWDVQAIHALALLWDLTTASPTPTTT